MTAPVQTRHATTTDQLRPMTFEEYRALPGDGPRYELLNGELVEMPAPKSIHQWAILRLLVCIDEFVMRLRKGIVRQAPYDVRLGPYTTVQPDISFFSTTNPNPSGPDYADGAPDLVIEVLSPSNRGTDLVRKRAIYAEHGVLEYWIVDPEAKTIAVNFLGGTYYSEVVYSHAPIFSVPLQGVALDFDLIFTLPDWITESGESAKDDAPDGE